MLQDLFQLGKRKNVMNARKCVAVLCGVGLSCAALASGQHVHSHDHGPSAIGQVGKAQQVSRTIQVEMLDTMRFSPSQVTVKPGETVRFVVKNMGKLQHEFVLGTQRDLDAHFEVMKKHPHMEHAEDNMLNLQPGQSGELIWTFSTAGSVSFACLYPGHYDAGMKGQVQVSPAKK
jgi:uncharacterized cupredoxin-like copper-binding protein